MRTKHWFNIQSSTKIKFTQLTGKQNTRGTYISQRNSPWVTSIITKNETI